MVGAVVARGDRVIGQGYHPAAGRPHAEVFALDEASSAARGATLYVSLEPCCHHGRTPPCTEAIIASGVARLVAAAVDPNPMVKGRGVAALRRSGSEVKVGLLEAEARRLNEAYWKHITTGLPFVTLKMATSLDGKIATRTGDSRWITGEQARAMAHRLRAEHDAIMVGIHTVIADDPELTARRGARVVKRPLRVVVDSRGRVPLKAKVLERDDRPAVVAITSKT
jgi:diaminohydroxyphosphoribosylaminopyrimidine deaminase/5-amino-6-(5-phosphoribosylamino)uracil reductase